MNSYGSEGPRKGPRNMLDIPATFLGALQWMRTGEYWESVRQRMVPIPTSVEIPANVRPSIEGEHDTVCVCVCVCVSR